MKGERGSFLVGDPPLAGKSGRGTKKDGVEMGRAPVRMTPLLAKKGAMAVGFWVVATRGIVGCGLRVEGWLVTYRFVAYR